MARKSKESILEYDDESDLILIIYKQLYGLN